MPTAVKYDFPTMTLVLYRHQLDVAVIALNERSCWYAVEPQPDDVYAVTFKAGEGIEGYLRKVLVLP